MKARITKLLEIYKKKYGYIPTSIRIFSTFILLENLPSQMKMKTP